MARSRPRRSRDAVDLSRDVEVHPGGEQHLFERLPVEDRLIWVRPTAPFHSPWRSYAASPRTSSVLPNRNSPRRRRITPSPRSTGLPHTVPSDTLRRPEILGLREGAGQHARKLGGAAEAKGLHGRYVARKLQALHREGDLELG